MTAHFFLRVRVHDDYHPGLPCHLDAAGANESKFCVVQAKELAHSM